MDDLATRSTRLSVVVVVGVVGVNGWRERRVWFGARKTDDEDDDDDDGEEGLNKVGRSVGRWEKLLCKSLSAPNLR
jgi:hypothetical protein